MNIDELVEILRSLKKPEGLSKKELSQNVLNALKILGYTEDQAQLVAEDMVDKAAK